MPINKDANLPIYSQVPLKSGTSAQQRLLDKQLTAQRKLNAKKYAKSQASQPQQRDLKMRYRRKRKRKAPRNIKAHEMHPDHSEHARKQNLRIRKMQKQLVEAGLLKTSYGAIPDELSG